MPVKRALFCDTQCYVNVVSVVVDMSTDNNSYVHYCTIVSILRRDIFCAVENLSVVDTSWDSILCSDQRGCPHFRGRFFCILLYSWAGSCIVS